MADISGRLGRLPRLVRGLLPALVLLSLAGCLTQLAPDYDKAIVDGITSVDEEALTLFATVEAGTKSGSFAERKESYDKVIGKLDSLRLLVSTRPIPARHNAAVAIVKQLPGAENIDPADFSAPTFHFVEHMSAIVTEMRDRDKRIGLRTEIVDLYRSEFEFEMVNTLTYEKALQR